MIRFVICVDVEDADTLEAYGKLSEGMKKSGLAWESTDEWYGADGEVGDPDELSEATMAYTKPASDGPPSDAATATGMYDLDEG